MLPRQCPDCNEAFLTAEELLLHDFRAHPGPRPERYRHERDLAVRAEHSRVFFERYHAALEEWRAFIQRFAGAPGERPPLITVTDREEMNRLRAKCHQTLDAWWEHLLDSAPADPIVTKPLEPR